MEKVRDDGIALDFEVGDEVVKIINVKSSSLPCPLLVFSPTTEGSYPILLFFHGFRLQPDSYKSLLLHISSHQYIAVAPKVYIQQQTHSLCISFINQNSFLKNMFAVLSNDISMRSKNSKKSSRVVIS